MNTTNNKTNGKPRRKRANGRATASRKQTQANQNPVSKPGTLKLTGAHVAKVVATIANSTDAADQSEAKAHLRQLHGEVPQRPQNPWDGHDPWSDRGNQYYDSTGWIGVGAHSYEHLTSAALARSVVTPVTGMIGPIETSSRAALGLAFPEKYPSRLHQDLNYPTSVMQLVTHFLLNSVDVAGTHRATLQVRPSLKQYLVAGLTYLGTAGQPNDTYSFVDHPSMASIAAMAVRYRVTGLATTFEYLPTDTECMYWAQCMTYDAAPALTVSECTDREYSYLAPAGIARPTRMLYRLHMPEDEDWMEPTAAFPGARMYNILQATSKQPFTMAARVVMNVELVPNAVTSDLLSPSKPMQSTEVYDDVSTAVASTGALDTSISAVPKKAVSTLGLVERIAQQVVKGASTMDKMANWLASSPYTSALAEVGVSALFGGGKSGKIISKVAGPLGGITAISQEEMKEILDMFEERCVPKSVVRALMVLWETDTRIKFDRGTWTIWSSAREYTLEEPELIIGPPEQRSLTGDKDI